MVLAAQLSMDAGRISAAEVWRIEKLVARAGLATKLPTISAAQMLDLMSRDKKNDAGNIRLILVDAIGQSRVDASVTHRKLSEFLSAHATQNLDRRAES